jgi:hypothetical protein
MPLGAKNARNRIHQVCHNRARQVLQRTKRPPDSLVKHIALANLVPPASELPYKDLSDKIDELVDSLPPPLSRNALLNMSLAFFGASVEFLHRHLPPDKFPQLYEYLGPISFYREMDIRNRFRDVYGTRALLDAIAGAQTKKAVAPGKEIEIPREATPMSVALDSDEEGKLQVTRWPLLDALVGVEANRIRRCSECPRIFWAGRIDKYACSDKCVNRRNVRLWRERYAEHYKLQRVRRADVAESTRAKSDDTTRRKSQ